MWFRRCFHKQTFVLRRNSVLFAAGFRPLRSSLKSFMLRNVSCSRRRLDSFFFASGIMVSLQKNGGIVHNLSPCLPLGAFEQYLAADEDFKEKFISDLIVVIISQYICIYQIITSYAFN